jgi:hypothetical protein
MPFETTVTLRFANTSGSSGNGETRPLLLKKVLKDFDELSTSTVYDPDSNLCFDKRSSMSSKLKPD